MDTCIYCKKYHHPFSICNGYIEWLSKQPNDIREKLNPKFTEKDLNNIKSKNKSED